MLTNRTGTRGWCEDTRCFLHACPGTTI